MSEYSKSCADVVNYKGRLILSPTQAPEGWGCPGVDTMGINRPVFNLRSDAMIGWFIGGLFIGALITLISIAVCSVNRKDD